MRLQNRTAVVTGPFNGLTQAVLRKLTEEGADVAFVGPASAFATRFMESINDAREVRSEYGRGAAFTPAKEDAASLRETISRIAESLGRMDVLVDATPLTWSASTTSTDAVAACQSWIELMQPFFKAKQRGRVVYVTEDDSLSSLRSQPCTRELRDALAAHLRDSAKALATSAINVNVVEIGLTEDFVLQHGPNLGSIRKSVEALQAKQPNLKLIENSDIAAAIAFLVSQASMPLTGHTLRMTQGLHL